MALNMRRLEDKLLQQRVDSGDTSATTLRQFRDACEIVVKSKKNILKLPGVPPEENEAMAHILTLREPALSRSILREYGQASGARAIANIINGVSASVTADLASLGALPPARAKTIRKKERRASLHPNHPLEQRPFTETAAILAQRAYANR